MIPVAGDVVEVGKEYMVPCVNGTPVVGTPHVDNDHFNRTEDHYHCDSRFTDNHHGALCAMRNAPSFVRGELRAYEHGAKVELEPRVCLRDTPLPFPEERFGMALMSLYADYGFTTAKCGVCPHKAMPIHNGVCSGHRLEWLPDGTIKYKPPYHLVIRGTGNHIEITERSNLVGVRFRIVDPVAGNPVYVDMHDRDGNKIGTQTFNVSNLSIGDQLTISP